MGKNTKIICTVVPNPNRTKETKKKSFSVFLTPRLPDSGKLKDYYEILYWNEFIKLFTDESMKSWLKVKTSVLTHNSDDSYTMSGEKQLRVIRDDSICRKDYRQQHDSFSDAEFFKLGSSIWRKLFPESTPVKGWILDEGENKTNKITQLFTTEEIKKILDEREPKKDNDSVIKDGISIGTQTSALTNPERDKLMKNLNNSDIANKKMSEDEVRLRNKENQEFHRKISVLAEYPHLLRLTGWIFDFQIIDEIPDNSYNTIKLDLSEMETFISSQSEISLWANFYNELDFKTPWSYFNYNDFSIKYLEKLKENYFEIENGFIKNEGHSYKLVATQFDHKLLKAKLEKSNDDSSTIEGAIDNRTSDLTSTGIAITVQRKEFKDQDGKVIYQNSPLVFGIYADPESLNSSITINRKKNESANIDDYIIFGHHLDNGYRVDVSMSKDETSFTPFRSLCLRNADYNIDKSPYSNKIDFIPLLTNFKDEPWVSESAQAGKSGTLYVDEELCRWNNWSLTCPHIGNYPQDEEKGQENHEFNDLELKDIKPTEQTLTPLRFSRNYKFRIRIVDICGNSVPCEFEENREIKGTPTPSGCEILLVNDLNNPDVYRRLEPVNPPELHFTENVFEGRLRNKEKEFIERKLKKEYHGEDLKTFVVRTKINDDNSIDIKDNSLRSVCPPRITESFSELHDSNFKLLTKANRNLIYQKAAYENTNTEVEIFKSQEEIPFLTDPVINSFDVRVFQDLEKKNKIQENTKGSNSNIWEQSDINFIKRKFNSIELKTSLLTETVTKSKTSIIVELKPGSIYKGEIESFIPQFSKTIFHLDSRLKDDDGNPVNGLNSKPKELLFISAVQKPLIIGKDGKAIVDFNLEGKLKERTPSTPSSSILLSFETLKFPDGGFPLSMTAEIKVIAEYDEIVCDKNTKEGFRIETEKVLVKSFSNFDKDISLKTDLVNKNDPTHSDNDDKRLLKVIEFKSLEHSFADTKYRSVKYKIELVSRFKDYFPNETDFSVFGKVSYKDDKGKLNNYTPIPNSKKLEALVIDSIVPVFSWEVGKDNATRNQEKFRIYLVGDWYQNGASLGKDPNGNFAFEEVEKVAVFFLEGEKTIPDEYEGLVSEFGKDPTTNANNERTNGITSTFFNIDKDEKIIDITKAEADFMNITISNPDNYKIKAAPFKVQYDFEKKKFYCDVKIKKDEIKNKYFPFVKFAVARYLKTSIKEASKYDFRFSNIITAPQVQVFPERVIKDPKGDFILDSIKANLGLKKLEIYLIMERNNEDSFNHLIDNSEILNSVEAIRLDSSINLPKDDKPFPETDVHYFIKTRKDIELKIRDFKPTSIYIEEYEAYNVFSQNAKEDFHLGELTENKNEKYFIDNKIEFGVNEIPDLDYNPRNDIRKRLVFTYQIK